MTEGKYNTWQSQEQNPNRLAMLNENVPDRPEASVRNRDDLLAECLAKQRRQLKTFLGQVAKCASSNMYAAIICDATSLEWIYNKICQDYNIQQKGIHFLNIVDLKYDPESKAPAGFYNEYRTMIINNVGRTNEVIHWNNNQPLAADETICPLFEDVILNVIQLIDLRLFQFIN